MATAVTRRADIEGLRAVAVVAVVLFHVGVPGVSGGFVGVDVFFVLSGFLITGLLLAEVRATGRVSLSRFWARRARRLLPLAALVSVATLAAAWLVMSPLELRDTVVDAVWSGLFAMNLHLAVEGVDYMAGTDPSPFQHYWSLAVEEQFYLLWPLLVLAVVVAARRVRTRRPRATGARTAPPDASPAGSLPVPLAVVTVVLVVASFTWGVAQTAAAQPLAYFLPTTRAWELGVGALLALAAPLACRLPPLVRPWLAVGGLAAVVGACVVLDEETPFPGTAALLPVLGTAAVVLAGTGGGATTAVARVLGLAPLQVLGRLSYGWYLWHWPVLLLAPRVLGADPDLPSRLLLAAAALGLAALTYALVEDPVRRHRALVAAPARSLAVGAACVVVAVGTAGAAGALLPQVRGSGPAQASVATGDGEEVALLGAVDAGKMLRRTPANLVPALDVAGQDVARARNADGVSCMVGVEHRDITREPGGSCVFGDHPSGPTTVVLTGDSHAYQWYPALERIADERGWRLVVMTKAGCPLYDVELVNRTLRRDYTECYEWRDAAMARIAQERPDLVVVSAAVFSPRDAAFVDRWAQGVATTTTALRASSGAVVSLQDTPIPGRDVPRCLAEHLDDVQACAVPREDALTDPARRSATAEAAAGSGATVVDPVPWFCDETCPPIIGNTLAYHDGDHITATYAEQLAPLLAEELVAAMHPGDRT